MKIIWKRMISIGLIAALLCGGVSVTALAAEKDAASAVIQGTYHFTSNELSNKQSVDTFVYRDDCFMRSSFLGCDHLLALSAQTAIASASRYGTAPDPYEIDPADNPSNIIQMLKDMGFQNVETNQYYRLEKLENSAGVAVGKRIINTGDKKYTLLAIVPRSAGYKQEWDGNFTVGDGDIHAGFKAGRDEVLRFVKKYIADHKIKGDLKVWISGHSRGSAISNLLGGFLAGGGMGYFGDSVSLVPENIYCYGYAVPRTIRDGAPKDVVLSVEGARGGIYKADTPGESFAYTGGGTINLKDPVYGGIRSYPLDWDFITHLPPVVGDWKYTYYGSVCTIDDNGRILVEEMEKELASVDPYIYNEYMNGGDYRNFKPMTFDLLNLEVKPTGAEGGKEAFANFVSRRISGIVTTARNPKEYVSNGTQGMFQGLAGVYGMTEVFSKELAACVDSSMAKPALLSYLAFASEKLKAEERAKEEGEASAIALTELLTHVNGKKMDPHTMTVDGLVEEVSKVIADHKDSKLVKTLLSAAAGKIPQSYRGFLRMMLAGFYPGTYSERIPTEDILYATFYAFAYGPLPGCANYGQESYNTPAKCRASIYTMLGMLESSVPNIKAMMGTNPDGVIDGSNTCVGFVTVLLPMLLKEKSGEKEILYASLAEAADAGLLKFLDNYFEKCEATIKEKSLYTPEYLQMLQVHEKDLKQHVSKLREMLMNVLFADEDTAFNTEDNIESVATLYGNIKCIPSAHYNEVFVAWGKAAAAKPGGAILPEISLKDMTASYTGKTINIGPAKVTADDTGKVTYVYYSDAACTKVVKEHINTGTYYVRAIVAEDAKYHVAVSNTAKLIIKAAKVTPKVVLTPESCKYNGSVRKPAVTVKAGSTTLKEDRDYTITWPAGRKDAGTYSLVVKLKGNYSGSAKAAFTIRKAVNSITKIAPSTKTLKAETVQRKEQAFKIQAVDKGGAQKTYAMDPRTSSAAEKWITVSNKGIVTVKKGTPKGRYTVKVKVKASETKNYRAKTETESIKIVVK